MTHIRGTGVTSCATLNSMGNMDDHHERGDTTAEAARDVSERGVFGILRGIALIALLAGAGASLTFMLRAGSRQNSRILVVLFGTWVLFPFLTGVWAHVFSKRWTVAVRATLYVVTLVVTLGSLPIYGGVAFGHLRAKVGFVFLVVPLASSLIIAIAVSIATVVSRRQPHRAD
jgi:hypothetical protein